MPAPWTPGRGVIDRFLSEKRLDRVTASRSLADEALTQARQHLASAEMIKVSDVTAAFALTYDAARKALAAVLINQGLRPVGAGAHITVYDAVTAQLVPPLGSTFKPFTWMRPLRHTSEYPGAGSQTATVRDVDEAIEATIEMIAKCSAVLDHMPPY